MRKVQGHYLSCYYISQLSRDLRDKPTLEYSLRSRRLAELLM
jgi:hypothetical protein